jgi:hypothetical protein
MSQIPITVFHTKNAVLYIFRKPASQCCGSGMFIPVQIFLSRIRIQGQKDCGYRVRIKEFKYFKPLKLLLSSRKMIRNVHPGSGFFHIPDPDPGSRGEKKHRIRILNTAASVSGFTFVGPTVALL